MKEKAGTIKASVTQRTSTSQGYTLTAGAGLSHFQKAGVQRAAALCRGAGCPRQISSSRVGGEEKENGKALTVGVRTLQSECHSVRIKVKHPQYVLSSSGLLFIHSQTVLVLRACA